MSDAPAAVEASVVSNEIFTKAQGYQSWSKFAANQTRMKSVTHMNMYVLTYHNDIVANAIVNKTLPLPDGALIVKENYAAVIDSMPMALTIMYKQQGDWYWLQAMPDGKVFLDDQRKPLEGKDVAMCVSCHRKSSNDAVMLHDFTM